MTVDGRMEPIVRQLERRHSLGHAALNLGEEHRLREPLHEKRRPIGGCDLDHVLRRLAAVLPAHKLSQRGKRVFEGPGLGRRSTTTSTSPMCSSKRYTILHGATGLCDCGPDAR